MADRTRGRGFVRSGPKRMVEWSGVVDQGYVNIPAGAKVIVQSLSFAEKATIVRNRGQFSVRPAVSNADASIVGAVGLGIVSAEALAAGAASIPGPFSQAEWDGWMVWQPLQLVFEFITDAGILMLSKETVIDSKAMRKVGANEVAVFMVESQAITFNISVVLRTLIKLA